jgi:hypothetical protein
LPIEYELVTTRRYGATTVPGGSVPGPLNPGEQFGRRALSAEPPRATATMHMAMEASIKRRSRRTLPA